MSKNRNLFLRGCVVALGCGIVTVLLMQNSNIANKYIKLGKDTASKNDCDTCVVDLVVDDVVSNKRIVFCKKNKKFISGYGVVTSDKDLFNGWDTKTNDTIVIVKNPTTGNCMFWYNISRTRRNICK